MLQGAVDAAGRCCDTGIVDTFGVCDGYDTSGAFTIALSLIASSASDAQASLAQVLGVDSSSLSVAAM